MKTIYALTIVLLSVMHFSCKPKACTCYDDLGYVNRQVHLNSWQKHSESNCNKKLRKMYPKDASYLHCKPS